MNAIPKMNIIIYIAANKISDIITLLNFISGNCWSLNNNNPLNIKKIDIIIFLISDRIINC